MRYTRVIIGTALLWALTACSSGPSKEFIQQVTTELNDLKTASEKLNPLKSEAANLQDPFASLKGELGKVWTDKVEKDKEIMEKVNSLTEQARKVASDIAALEGELNSALSEAQGFVDSLAMQSKKEEELKSAWEGIKAKVSGVVGKVDGISQQLSQVKSEIEAHVGAIKSKYGPKEAAKK
ncbi:MAG: hypothetical protein NZ933_07225 [Bacteroidia bacterium]|nr:hypothetical protein [Bacteroidia bacterium]